MFPIFFRIFPFVFFPDFLFFFSPGIIFYIKEKSSAFTDIASYGQLWIKNDTPNNLYFVNDIGNEVQITNGASLAGC